jgi:hypothetical protein
MARRSSRISNHGPTPLHASRASLDRRWSFLSQSIGEALGLDRRDVQIEADYQDEAVWAGLVGQACERVSRERGGFYSVAPLSQLPRGLIAWLGLQEVWELSGRDIHQYAFRHLSLTVHFGFAGDPLKPQVFRSEWSGIRNWTGAGLAFQSPGAGHPHWQFDLNATLRARADEIRNLEAGEFDNEVVEDFQAKIQEQDVLAMLRLATLERMHFASAAPWWTRQTTDGHPLHMNAPADKESLSRWLLTCIAYLRQELARCEIGS